MKPIHYLRGDATAPQDAGNKIIVHVCNDIGGWGKGFVLALSRRWQEPERAFRAWHKQRESNSFGLGAVQFVQVEPNTWVANLVGQHGLKANEDAPPVRYEAIRQGLAQVAQKAKELDASVHMPRIGCGLAARKWERIEPLIINELSEQDIAVYVYDLK